jgi:hypothetical protein
MNDIAYKKSVLGRKMVFDDLEHDKIFGLSQ